MNKLSGLFGRKAKKSPRDSPPPPSVKSTSSETSQKSAKSNAKIPEEIKVLKEGHVHGGILPLKSKKKIYVVLVERALEIYDTEKDWRRRKAPQKLIDLSTVFNVAPEHYAGHLAECMAVLGPDETLVIRGIGPDDTHEWFEAILAAVIPARALKLGRPVQTHEFFQISFDLNCLTPTPKSWYQYGLAGREDLPNILDKHPSWATEWQQRRVCFYAGTVVICKRKIEPAKSGMPPEGIPPFKTTDFVEAEYNSLPFYGTFDDHFLIRFGRGTVLGGCDIWSKINEDDAPLVGAFFQAKMGALALMDTEKRKKAMEHTGVVPVITSALAHIHKRTRTNTMANGEKATPRSRLGTNASGAGSPGRASSSSPEFAPMENRLRAHLRETKARMDSFEEDEDSSKGASSARPRPSITPSVMLELSGQRTTLLAASPLSAPSHRRWSTQLVSEELQGALLHRSATIIRRNTNSPLAHLSGRRPSTADKGMRAICTAISAASIAASTASSASTSTLKEDEEAVRKGSSHFNVAFPPRRASEAIYEEESIYSPMDAGNKQENEALMALPTTKTTTSSNLSSAAASAEWANRFVIDHVRKTSPSTTSNEETEDSGGTLKVCDYSPSGSQRDIFLHPLDESTPMTSVETPPPSSSLITGSPASALLAKAMPAAKRVRDHSATDSEDERQHAEDDKASSAATTNSTSGSICLSTNDVDYAHMDPLDWSGGESTGHLAVPQQFDDRTFSSVESCYNSLAENGSERRGHRNQAPPEPSNHTYRANTVACPPGRLPEAVKQVRIGQALPEPAPLPRLPNTSPTLGANGTTAAEDMEAANRNRSRSMIDHKGYDSGRESESSRGSSFVSTLKQSLRKISGSKRNNASAMSVASSGVSSGGGPHSSSSQHHISALMDENGRNRTGSFGSGRSTPFSNRHKDSQDHLVEMDFTPGGNAGLGSRCGSGSVCSTESPSRSRASSFGGAKATEAAAGHAEDETTLTPSQILLQKHKAAQKEDGTLVVRTNTSPKRAVAVVEESDYVITSPGCSCPFPGPSVEDEHALQSYLEQRPESEIGGRMEGNGRIARTSVAGTSESVIAEEDEDDYCFMEATGSSKSSTPQAPMARGTASSSSASDLSKRLPGALSEEKLRTNSLQSSTKTLTGSGCVRIANVDSTSSLVSSDANSSIETAYMEMPCTSRSSVRDGSVGANRSRSVSPAARSVPEHADSVTEEMISRGWSKRSSGSAGTPTPSHLAAPASLPKRSSVPVLRDDADDDEPDGYALIGMPTNAAAATNGVTRNRSRSGILFTAAEGGEASNGVSSSEAPPPTPSATEESATLEYTCFKAVNKA